MNVVVLRSVFPLFFGTCDSFYLPKSVVTSLYTQNWNKKNNTRLMIVFRNSCVRVFFFFGGMLCVFCAMWKEERRIKPTKKKNVSDFVYSEIFPEIL